MQRARATPVSEAATALSAEIPGAFATHHATRNANITNDYSITDVAQCNAHQETMVTNSTFLIIGAPMILSMATGCALCADRAFPPVPFRSETAAAAAPPMHAAFFFLMFFVAPERMCCLPHFSCIRRAPHTARAHTHTARAHTHTARAHHRAHPRPPHGTETASRHRDRLMALRPPTGTVTHDPT